MVPSSSHLPKRRFPNRQLPLQSCAQVNTEQLEVYRRVVELSAGGTTEGAAAILKQIFIFYLTIIMGLLNISKFQFFSN
jgi:hypothetical protein